MYSCTVITFYTGKFGQKLGSVNTTTLASVNTDKGVDSNIQKRIAKINTVEVKNVLVDTQNNVNGVK